MIQRIRNKIKALDSNPHMREVTRNTGIAFILKIAGAGLAFCLNIAIARLLGAEGAGVYFLSLSIVVIASVIGRVGLDNTLLRFVAIYATSKEWGKVKGTHILGMMITMAASGTITLIIILISPWMADKLFNKPELAIPLQWMSLSIIPFALLNLKAQCLKGLKHISAAMFVQGVGLSLIALLLIYPLVEIASVTGAAWCYVIATIVTLGIGAFIWHKQMIRHNTFVILFPLKEIWASCQSLYVAELMNRALIPWMPTIFLSIWASSEEVGIFSVASRIALLVSFMLLTVNNVLAPKFAELFAQNDIKNLVQTARRSTLLITALASPLFAFLFLYGEWVMALFGEEFIQGSQILSILIFGQLINVICGSIGYFLMMSGNEQTYRNITVATTLILLLLIAILTPILGGTGTAIATVLATISMNCAAIYAVYSKLGIILIPGPWKPNTLDG